MTRYSIAAEFFLDAESPEDAAVTVGNFIDSFPNEVEDGDVILQGPAEETDA